VLLFLRTPDALEGKKSLRRLLRKSSSLFHVNGETGKIDHGQLKDANFEDDRQPKIAMNMATKTAST